MRITRGIAAVLSATACWTFAADKPVTYGPPVIVTATRFEDRPDQYPIGVAVITEEEIRTSTAATVPELLKLQAGIRVRDLSGSPGLQVDMRGFGIFGDQNTLVLLDGVRVSENEQTPVNWGAIPLSAIERIEILRGSGAVLYGGGATGGTINIITKRAARGEKSVTLGGGAGTYGTGDLRAGFNVGGDNLALRVNASGLDTDNYRVNNRLRQRNLQADLRATGNNGAVTLKFGVDEQDLQLPGSISEAQIAANRRQAATPFDFSSRSGRYVNLGAELKLGEAELAANLAYRDKDASASFFVGTPFRNNVDTDMKTWSFAPRLKLRWGVGSVRNTFIAGLDWDDWDFDSQAGPAVVGRPHAVQRNRALYMQNTTALTPAATVSLGVRAHEVKYAVNDAANPGAADSRRRDLHAYEVAARYRASEQLSFYGKFGYSFRVPNVNDIYNLFAAAVTILEPQRSRDREAGIELSSGGARYRFALYQMDLDDEIFFDPVTFNNRNLPPTRRYGAEVEGQWSLGPARLFANYTYAISEFRSGSFGGVSLAGKRVPLVPRHAANFGVAWDLAARTTLSAVAAYVGEQVFDADETDTFGRKMPSYTVVDLKLVHRTGGWQLAAAIRNLTNERYFSYGVFTGFPTFSALPAPERSVFVSAQYSFQ